MSANAQDSLSDGYLAAGQNDLALAAEQKCLELLPGGSTMPEFKQQIEQARKREDRETHLRSRSEVTCL